MPIQIPLFLQWSQHTPGGESGAAIRANWEYHNLNFTLTPTPINGLNQSYILSSQETDNCVGVHAFWTNVAWDISRKVRAELKPDNSVLNTVDEFFVSYSLSSNGASCGHSSTE